MTNGQLAKAGQPAAAVGQKAVTLLLVLPRFPEGFWTFSWIFRHLLTNRRAGSPPLGLATIAALTPAHWNVRIVDENVEPIDFDAEADIVAVGGMSVQQGRQLEIMREFRGRGRYLVAGGSFVTLCPEQYTADADTLIIGEAERIWPAFCRDFEAGQPQLAYREAGELPVPLSLSPVPRHDLLHNDRYLAGAIQFSRGCPYLCEFCDIIVMFSRKPRQKSLEQVEAELDSMRAAGVRNVMFVDDNLIGNPGECRKLLAFLVDYQHRKNYRFAFGAELTVNVVSHPDILDLLRRANFGWLFLGIETPNKESLAETRKTQNLKKDLIESIQTIYSYGIDVFGGFIVGFDSDDLSIFDQQLEFIVDAGIVIAMAGMLMAPPRTPLYQRLHQAGRLVTDQVKGEALINAGLSTNIIPLQMTREQLYAGTADLHRRLLDDRNIHRRVVNKLRHLRRPRSYHFEVREWWPMFSGLLVKGILKGGPRRCWYFLASVAFAFRRPLGLAKTLPMVMANWGYALALRDYVERTMPEGSVSLRPNEEKPPVREPVSAILSEDGVGV